MMDDIIGERPYIEVKRPQRFAVPGLHVLPSNPPQEPRILQKAQETMKWLEQLDTILRQIRNKMDATDNDAGERTSPQDLSEMLSRTSSDAASLCGLAQTINEALGE